MTRDSAVERTLPDGTIVTIREATTDDMPFLEEMAVLTFNGADPEQQSRTAGQVKREKTPGVYEYLQDLLQREGDLAVIAEHDGRPVGAAWLGYWPKGNDWRSASFINETVPERSIAIVPEMRGKGAGGKRGLSSFLAEELSNIAGQKGISQLSASVDTNNVRSWRSLHKMREAVALCKLDFDNSSRVVYYINVPHPVSLGIFNTVKNLGLPSPPPPVSHANGIPYRSINTLGPPTPAAHSWVSIPNPQSPKR